MMPKKSDPKPKQRASKPVGRPTKYTPELGKKICDAISTTTFGLRKLCSMYSDFPEAETLRTWRIYNEEFSAWYVKAKMHQADNLAEDCLDIADDDSRDIRFTKDGDETFNSEFAARSRIRIDTRKWLAAKLLPKQYGDKLLLEQKSEENDKLKCELIELRQRLDSQNRKDY